MTVFKNVCIMSIYCVCRAFYMYKMQNSCRVCAGTRQNPSEWCAYGRLPAQSEQHPNSLPKRTPESKNKEKNSLKNKHFWNCAICARVAPPELDSELLPFIAKVSEFGRSQSIVCWIIFHIRTWSDSSRSIRISPPTPNQSPCHDESPVSNLDSKSFQKVMVC